MVEILEKECTKCHAVKPLTEFYSHTVHGNKMPHAECKDCTLKGNKNNRLKIINANTDAMITEIESSNISKICLTCKELKHIRDFSIRRSEIDGHSSYCRDCSSKIKKLKHHNHKLLPTKEYEQWRLEENTKRKVEKLRMKIDVFEHYSKDGIIKCVNPYHIHNEEITDLDILTLDHINGDGKYDKDDKGRRIGGILIYRRCKRLGYPQGFQVLCANCQAKKAVLNNERYTNRWLIKK